MLWFNKHARSRKRLSPYIDGQLSPQKRTTLEAHLAGCDACRRELDELRATISAVGGLADVESPRSFAISPRMLERRAAVPLASLPPLATGMRLAGAGLAVALAVVLIGDLGVVGSGDGSRDETGAPRQAAELRMAEYDTEQDAGGAPAPAATGAVGENAPLGVDQASPDDVAMSGEKTEACPSSAGQARDAAAAPEPAPSAPSAGELAACAPAAAEIAPDAGTPANADALRDDGDEGEVAAAPESPSGGGDGVSTLTVIEIILSGGLVALVGGIGIEYILRRRAV